MTTHHTKVFNWTKRVRAEDLEGPGRRYWIVVLLLEMEIAAVEAAILDVRWLYDRRIALRLGQPELAAVEGNLEFLNLKRDYLLYKRARRRDVAILRSRAPSQTLAQADATQ